eukprot:2384044-Pleurochrysis_carterae.AAC.5
MRSTAGFNMALDFGKKALICAGQQCPGGRKDALPTATAQLRWQRPPAPHQRQARALAVGSQRVVTVARSDARDVRRRGGGCSQRISALHIWDI